MTEKQIKRGLCRLDRAFPLRLWSSWYSYYDHLKEYSDGDSPAIKIVEIAAEYALTRDPVKRVRAENKEFQKRLKRRKFQRDETKA